MYLFVQNSFDEIHMLSQNHTLCSVHLDKVVRRQIESRPLVDDVHHNLGYSSLLISVKHMVVRLHITVNQLKQSN